MTSEVRLLCHVIPSFRHEILQHLPTIGVEVFGPFLEVRASLGSNVPQEGNHEDDAENGERYDHLKEGEGENKHAFETGHL